MNGHTDCDDYEEVRIPVPWGYITGKWWGPTHAQPVIAIHGWQDNAGTFDNLAPILRDRGISIYCIDLPGHGFSSHIPIGQNYYLFWDGVSYLRRIVRYFGWDKISIIGHSLGGGIGFMYSALFPEEVDKFVSIDIASPYVRRLPTILDTVESCIDTFFKYEEKYLGNDPPVYQYEDMVTFMMDAHKGSITEDSAKILLRRGMRQSKSANGFEFTRDPRLKISLMGAISKDQAMEMASRITCEVLNLRAIDGLDATHEDLCYDEFMELIRKQAKKLEVQFIEGAHHLHLNDAESVSSYIYYFLTAP